MDGQVHTDVVSHFIHVRHGKSLETIDHVRMNAEKIENRKAKEVCYGWRRETVIMTRTVHIHTTFDRMAKMMMRKL